MIAPEALLGIPVGLSRDEDHRYYWRESASSLVRGPIPSVTSVIKIVDSSGPLIGWAKNVTADAALDYASQLPQWVSDFGKDAARKMLTAKATSERDKAAGKGSRIHTLAEALARGQDVTVEEELREQVTQYLRFLADWKPAFRAVEFMVCSLTHDFAGTGDIFADIDGVPTLIDIKTGKGIYSEAALQLAAYGNAEFAGRPGDAKHYRPIRATQYAVLHLRPDSYELVPYEVTKDTFAAFLNARQLWGWKNGAAKEVIGQPKRRATIG